MIKMWAYDVEVLPNFFSVVFVDIVDYMDKFKDCVINDKAIPLTQKLSVEEIKNRLSKVNTKSFYITDKNDDQLLQMIGFINAMIPHRENGIAIRNDIFGYNSMSYDKLMIACLLMNATECNNTKELITKLYTTSKKIIELQDKDDNVKDYYIETLKNYKLPYKDIDIMKVFALNKVGAMNDDNGEKKYYGKGLKQVSINLQWYDIIEYELPDISNIDRHYYNKDVFDPYTDKQLSKIIEKWDRYIIDDWIPDTMKYNTNDVFIVAEMVRLYSDEIKLRYNLTKAYEVDLLNSSRSNIADKLFIKFYSEFSGLDYKRWGKKKTERRAMAFNKVIFDNIKFKTPELQNLLEEMKNVTIYSIGKDSFKKEIKLGNLVYTIATGGLHSQDIPRELKSKVPAIIPSTGSVWQVMESGDYIYVHWDISSFYPSIMVKYRIAPNHMDTFTFCKLLAWLRDTRISAKHSEEPYIDGIPKKLLAEALKIVINSIYGKLGYEYGDICDRLAVLKVTINGQLMIMMLCEELELNGIEVVSANTDGIVVKLYKDKKETFDEIANRWMEYTGLSADSEEYKAYINRDINNYICQEFNGKVTYKGALNPNMYLVDLSKGYDMPIVAKAVSEYFLNGVPILDTLYNEDNILMFCKTQNVGKQFHVEFKKGIETTELQRYVRFYVSLDGGSIYKVRNVVVTTGQMNNMAAGYCVTVLNTLDDRNIAVRNINYTYYYNECMKIIDPIKLRISPGQEPGRGKAGKTLIKKYSGQYNTLFDDE